MNPSHPSGGCWAVALGVTSTGARVTFTWNECDGQKKHQHLEGSQSGDQ